jgi:hypothetical protein
MTDNIRGIYLRRSPSANLACSHSFLTGLFLEKLFNACCGTLEWHNVSQKRKHSVFKHGRQWVFGRYITLDYSKSILSFWIV